MPRWPTRASGISRSAPSVIPSPARRIAITTISSASRIPPVVSSGVSIASSRTRRSRSASNSSSIEMSESRRRKSLDGVARSRSTERWRATSGWSTTVTPVIGRGRYSLGADDGARPQRRAQGARPRSRPARWSARSPRAREDRGLLRQRDTYFARRARAAEAARGGARRRDADRLRAPGRRRPSACRSYRLVPVAEPEPLRAALAAAERRRARSSSSAAACCCGRPVRIHLDEVRGLGSFLELEAVAGPGLRPEPRARAGRAPARACSRSATTRCARAPTPTRCSAADAARDPDPELLALAREAAGARLRAVLATSRSAPRVRTDRRPPLRRRERGERRLPAGPVRGGVGDRRARRRAAAGAIAEVVVAAPSRELCTPCGGCRQRLREFAADDAPIHLVDLERVRRTTSLGELLPLSFGPEHLAA